MSHENTPASLMSEPVAIWRARLLWWGPVALFMIAIFVASSVEDLPTPGGADRASHFVAYGGLSGLILRALCRGVLGNVSWRTAVRAIALAGVYGVSDELHQMFVPGRVPDTGDIAADFAGATVVAGTIWAWGIITASLRSS